MIVKNEEETLARCLNSVYDLVDEIIIVDTGSSDRTVEIAARFTEKIYRYPWNDDFAAARNESFSKASMDYCMWLDADDILEPAEREKFLLLKQSLPPGFDFVFRPSFRQVQELLQHGGGFLVFPMIVQFAAIVV